jgi:hypothetical protein
VQRRRTDFRFGLLHPDFSPILQQLPRLDRERLCNAGDIIDRHVALRALDRADIGAVGAAFVRKRLLAQAARSAQRAAGAYSPPERRAAVPSVSVSRTQSCQLTGLWRALLRYIQTRSPQGGQRRSWRRAHHFLIRTSR